MLKFVCWLGTNCQSTWTLRKSERSSYQKPKQERFLLLKIVPIIWKGMAFWTRKCTSPMQQERFSTASRRWSTIPLPEFSAPTSATCLSDVSAAQTKRALIQLRKRSSLSSFWRNSMLERKNWCFMFALFLCPSLSLFTEIKKQMHQRRFCGTMHSRSHREFLLLYQGRFKNKLESTKS